MLLLQLPLVYFYFLFFFDVFNYVLFCIGVCWWNAIIITVVLLMCLGLSVCSILPKIQEFNPRVGLLQSAIFTTYCSYYVYSAILSEPTCGQLPFDWARNSSTTSDWITLIFGAIFTVISVVYASVRVGISKFSADDSMIVEEEMKDLETEEVANDEEIEEIEENEEDSKPDDEKNACAYNYSLFHLAFALGAMYVCMLLTNWSVISGYGDTPKTDSGWVSVVVKISSCLFAGLLYLWTIFAPAILPNRDWD